MGNKKKGDRQNMAVYYEIFVVHFFLQYYALMERSGQPADNSKVHRKGAKVGWLRVRKGCVDQAGWLVGVDGAETGNRP